jgi:hypothetical protein
MFTPPAWVAGRARSYQHRTNRASGAAFHPRWQHLTVTRNLLALPRLEAGAVGGSDMTRLSLVARVFELVLLAVFGLVSACFWVLWMSAAVTMLSHITAFARY